MPSAPIRRKVVLLLLAALLAAPWVSLAGPRLDAAASSAPLDLLSRFWSFLTSLWSEEGCRLDPNGCANGAAEQVDEGCSLDPDGCAKRAAEQVDEGCHIDPNGCRP